MKKIVHPVSGQSFALGRKRPNLHGPKLRLSNYLLRHLPAAPASCDYTKKAESVLAQVLMNDKLGCCTASAAFHIDGAMLDNAGALASFTDNDVVAFYSATAGYVPGDESTDNGADEQTVLSYWHRHGLVGGQHTIDGWMAVNGVRAEEVKTAIWLFENVYFGVELPEAWISNMPSDSGFIWGMAGDPVAENGHAFCGLGYDEEGVFISTWGMIGKITWPAIAKYASTRAGGELYTVFSMDSIAKASGKAPNGFSRAALVADADTFFGAKLPA